MASGAGERIVELLPCMSVPRPLLSVGFVILSGLSTISPLFCEPTGSAVGSFLVFFLSFGPFVPY